MELTPFHGPPARPPRIPGLAARTLLGSGAHGEVWRADDLETGRPVAVKVGRAVAGWTAERLEQETAVLSRLRHPHVVRLHRVVRLPEGDGLALVLDLAEGGSLASLVAARGRLDPREVSTVLIPLADALAHLHERGVVHGDLSPGNILFSGDGRPQLGDLGVARVLGVRAEEVWSTPGFTDPTVDGDPRVGDRWALAAIGWFALTGQPPGPAASATGRPEPPTDLPVVAADLLDLLSRCLAVDPDERPGLSELADGAWRVAPPVPLRLEGETPVQDPEVGLPPLSQLVTHRAPLPRDAPSDVPSDEPDSTRHTGIRWWVVVAAALVAVTTLGGAVVLVIDRQPGPPSRSVAAAVTPTAVTSAAVTRTSPTPPAVTPTAVAAAELTAAVDRIGRTRARAFRSLSASVLDTADASGSPAHAADEALVHRLRRAGCHLAGVEYEVSGLRVVGREGGVVRVRVTVTTSGHRRVTAGGSVAVAPDGPRPVVLTLVPAAGVGAERWRVREVAAA